VIKAIVDFDDRNFDREVVSFYILSSFWKVYRNFAIAKLTSFNISHERQGKSLLCIYFTKSMLVTVLQIMSNSSTVHYHVVASVNFTNNVFQSLATVDHIIAILHNGWGLHSWEMSHSPKHFLEIISLFSESCPFEKRPFDKMSVRQNVGSAKCLLARITGCWIMFSEKFPRKRSREEVWSVACQPNPHPQYFAQCPGEHW
jgi:hypothetical protein